MTWRRVAWVAAVGLVVAFVILAGNAMAAAERRSQQEFCDKLNAEADVNHSVCIRDGEVVYQRR